MSEVVRARPRPLIGLTLVGLRMPTFVVEPHRGVEPVRLGMARADVHRAMPGGRVSFRKTPASAHDTDAWHDNGFQVFYGGLEPSVEFIEVSADRSYVVKYNGLDVFATPADELVKIVAADAPFDEADPELGYSYVFPRLELALWRPTRERPYFATIAVGIAGYFSGGAGEAH